MLSSALLTQTLTIRLSYYILSIVWFTFATNAVR